MIKLRINNNEYEVQDGLTILEVARGVGLAIPTLCHKDNLPHFSSCMVCMVKDNRSNSFMPSCSALVQDGIDLTGEAVINLRKKAIELLLSEHRAECEAPCRVVCPSGYNIPLMNRLIAEGDFKGAARLSLESTGSSEITCLKCKGYCENACRRKKIDLPVSIRNLQLYVCGQAENEAQENTRFDKSSNNEIQTGPDAKIKQQKRFSSHTGILYEDELQEWLKECSNEVIRNREISDNIAAIGEAKSCMHCDCRAADDCRLRSIAEEYSVKDPRGKFVNSPIVKKINRNTGLVFENAKCIKCGLCVRLCEEMHEEPSLCFINRGFVSIISEPLTEEFDNILRTKSKEVIEICPTGALSRLK
jgi:ferredoxin